MNDKSVVDFSSHVDFEENGPIWNFLEFQKLFLIFEISSFSILKSSPKSVELTPSQLPGYLSANNLNKTKVTPNKSTKNTEDSLHKDLNFG